MMQDQSGTSRDITVALLQSIGAFHDLPVEQVERLVSLMVRKSYAPGQLIFVEGEPVIGLWFVVSGQVKIAKHALSGRILSLCILRSGMCFGGCPLFSHDTNPATAEALTEVTLLILPRAELDHYTKHDPKVAEALLRVYSQRLAHLARLSDGLANWSVGDRINDSLLTCADSTPEGTYVLLTHEKLADLAGTVREIVTRHLTQLEREGIVHVQPGRITILNAQALYAPCAVHE
jgi:CRP/FNR family transcriptional regulator